MSKSPPPGYHPGVAPPPGFQTQDLGGPAAYYIPVLGPHSQTLRCPSCHATVVTRLEPETSIKTHLIAALLCLSGCCCIPYCIDSCKDRNHYCPQCHSFIGTHK